MKYSFRNLLVACLVALIVFAVLLLGYSFTAGWTRQAGNDYKEDDGVACIQVITPARNLRTGEIRDFPTPCDVPDGWEILNRPQ